MSGFAILSAALLSVSSLAQTGWSVDAQKARIKREDDLFYRRLPRNEDQRKKLMAAYVSLPYGERILDGWKPAYEPTDKPKALKPKPGLNISGRWKRMQGQLGAAFRIAPEAGHYAVKFATWDRKGSEVFYRNGTLKAGILQLDRPVFDVIEHPFSKIYIVKAGKDVRLLPSADVALLEKLAGTSHRAQAIAGLTFHRV